MHSEVASEVAFPQQSQARGRCLCASNLGGGTARSLLRGRQCEPVGSLGTHDQPVLLHCISKLMPLSFSIVRKVAELRALVFDFENGSGVRIDLVVLAFLTQGGPAPLRSVLSLAAMPWASSWNAWCCPHCLHPGGFIFLATAPWLTPVFAAQVPQEDMERLS